jgi:hypothetical protein
MSTRRRLASAAIAACAAILPSHGICQETVLGTSPSRPPANLLAQLNDSLERLASTVAPAVVQI